MPKRKRSPLTQQQWLNMVIISVSAMFLLSILVGRMMDPTVDRDPAEVNPADITINKEIVLVRIDFGEVQLVRKNNQWIASTKAIKKEQSLMIAQRWQSLLQQKSTTKNGERAGGKTILLYLSGVTQPVVCKIGVTESEMQIFFLASGQQFSFPADRFNSFYPEPKSKSD